MTVAKISGLNTVLTDTIIKNGMGFGIADRSSWLGIFKGSLPSRTDVIGDVTQFRKSDLLWASVLPNESVLSLSYQVGESDFIMPKANGHATWFLLAGIEDATNIAHACLIGNTSTNAGSGDLMLSSLDFVKGTKYRVHYLQIAFPYSFVY